MEKLSPSSAKVSEKSIYNHTIKIYTNGYRSSQIFCSISSKILNSLIMIFKKQLGIARQTGQKWFFINTIYLLYLF